MGQSKHGRGRMRVLPWAALAMVGLAAPPAAADEAGSATRATAPQRGPVVVADGPGEVTVLAQPDGSYSYRFDTDLAAEAERDAAASPTGRSSYEERRVAGTEERNERGRSCRFRSVQRFEGDADDVAGLIYVGREIAYDPRTCEMTVAGAWLSEAAARRVDPGGFSGTPTDQQVSSSTGDGVSLAAAGGRRGVLRSRSIDPVMVDLAWTEAGVVWWDHISGCPARGIFSQINNWYWFHSNSWRRHEYWVLHGIPCSIWTMTFGHYRQNGLFPCLLNETWIRHTVMFEGMQGGQFGAWHDQQKGGACAGLVSHTYQLSVNPA